MSYFYSLAELSWDLIGLWHKHIASDKYGSTANVYFFLSQIWRKKIKIIFFMNYNYTWKFSLQYLWHNRRLPNTHSYVRLTNIDNKCNF